MLAVEVFHGCAEYSVEDSTVMQDGVPNSGAFGSRSAVRKILLETIVSDVFDISFRDLRRASRGRAHVALARQVAMYLAHVQFGLSLTEVGRVFKRDRTTVAHACAVVEDRRDDPTFDYVLELLERVVAAYEAPRPALFEAV